MQITQYPYAKSQTCDLAYTILLSIGGTMADIKGIYASNLDDILFAVATMLSSGKVALLIDSYRVPVTNDNRSTVNYPAIIGASKVLISIGGVFIDGVVTDSRYFLANTSNIVVGGLQPGDIDMPNVVFDEQVIIFKF